MNTKFEQTRGILHTAVLSFRGYVCESHRKIGPSWQPLAQGCPHSTCPSPSPKPAAAANAAPQIKQGAPTGSQSLQPHLQHRQDKHLMKD